jgi:hypothetical protein
MLEWHVYAAERRSAVVEFEHPRQGWQREGRWWYA